MDTCSCKFCNGKWINEEISIRSNADLCKTFCLIAQGDAKKEFIFSVNSTAYGVEIDFCPFCGRRLKQKGWD
jgi:hypothetical protein